MSLTDKLKSVGETVLIFTTLTVAGGLIFLTFCYPEYKLSRELESKEREIHRLRRESHSYVDETYQDQNQDGWPDLTYRDENGKQHILFGYKDGKFYSEKEFYKILNEG